MTHFLGMSGFLSQLADGRYGVYCPGCEEAHIFDERWSFDGNVERPTFSPSLLVNGDPKRRNPELPRCHSHVRDGQWHFLSDCSHKLAGRVVPMERFRWH